MNIHDKTFLFLLDKIFQVKVLSKENKKPFCFKNCSLHNNLLALFLSQVYLSPLDNYAKNLGKLYDTDKKSDKTDISSKLTILIKKRIAQSVSHNLNIRTEQIKENYPKNFPLSYADIFIKIKYVRYANDFIFGILSSKK